MSYELEAEDILREARIKLHYEAGGKASKIWEFLEHASNHIRPTSLEAQNAAFDHIMSNEATQ